MNHEIPGLTELDVARKMTSPQSHRRRFRLFAGAVLGVVVLAGSAAVYSVVDTFNLFAGDGAENPAPSLTAPLPTETPEGEETAPQGSEGETDGATWVNPAESDYVAWALGAYNMTLPQPPGISLEEAAAQHAQGWHDTILRDYGWEGIAVEALAQTGSWEQAVQCLWVEEWLNAGDDSERRSAAETALIGSLDWPGPRFGDSPQDGDQAEYWRAAAEAFAEGDRPAIKQFGASRHCPIVLQDIER